MPELKDFKTGMLTNKGVVDNIYNGHIYVGRSHYTPDTLTIAGEKQKADYFTNDFAKHLSHYGHTIGSDPEIFVVDKDNQVIPAFLFLPGKEEPKSSYCGNAGEVHVYNDGFQAEMRMDAYDCLSWTIDAIHGGLKSILAHARKFNKTARLESSTTLPILEELLLTSPAKNVILGCAPSFNAYGDHGEHVVDGRLLPIRFAGTHMHFGSEKLISLKTLKEKRALANQITQVMDTFVGLGSVALFGELEDTNRRRFYGLAGEYRLPQHGYEYRVVSSRMLHHPVFCHLLFDIGRYAFNLGLMDWFQYINKNDINDVRKAINHSDKKAAIKLIKQNEHIWMAILNKKFGSIKPWKILTNAAKLKSGTIEENWRLDKVEDDYEEGWISHSESPNCSVDKMILEN